MGGEEDVWEALGLLFSDGGVGHGLVSKKLVDEVLIIDLKVESDVLITFMKVR